MGRGLLKVSSAHICVLARVPQVKNNIKNGTAGYYATMVLWQMELMVIIYEYNNICLPII